MPAINVNPLRPGRRGARRFCGAKAPSPRGGAPLKADGGARRGGVIHARD